MDRSPDIIFLTSTHFAEVILAFFFGATKAVTALFDVKWCYNGFANILSLSSTPKTKYNDKDCRFLCYGS